MTATPGQRAYDAAVRVMLGDDDDATLVPGDGPDFAWDAIGSIERDSWEAAAQAVLNDAFPGLREQVRLARQDRDQLRTAVLSLAAELENEAAGTYSAALRLRDDPAGLVLEEQAEAKRSTAIRLRKTAEPPA